MMNDLPPPIPPHQQEARTQAVVTIGHFLEGLGEPGWRSVLLCWLGRYDGLEVYLYPEDDPVLTVRDLLARYVEALRPPDPALLAADLAALPFCRFRPSANWNLPKVPLAPTLHVVRFTLLKTTSAGATGDRLEPMPA